MRKRIAAVLTSLVSALLIPLTVYADGSADIAVPDAVSAGDSITVNVNIHCDSNIGTVSANLSYDETVLEFVSSDYASGGGGELVIPAAFPDSPTGDMTLDFSFNVIDEGEAAVSVSGYAFDAEGTIIAELSASNTVIAEGGDAPQTETQTVTETAPPEQTEAPEQTSADTVTQQTEPAVEAVTEPAEDEANAAAATVKQTESSTSSSEKSLEKERNDLAKKLTIPLLIILATLILALVIVTMWIRKRMKSKDK